MNTRINHVPLLGLMAAALLSWSCQENPSTRNCPTCGDEPTSTEWDGVSDHQDAGTTGRDSVTATWDAGTGERDVASDDLAPANPVPDAATRQPEAAAPKPDAAAPKPDAATLKPDAAVPDQRPAPPDSGYPSSCAAAPGGGSSTVTAPVHWRSYANLWHEGWVSSPAVVDIDGDGSNELVVTRDNRVIVWSADGQLRWFRDMYGRIWASPVVADLLPQRQGLEIIIASRDEIKAWDARGDLLPGFPVDFEDETRSIAAGDIDGDGMLEIVGVTTGAIVVGDIWDVVLAFNHDGTRVEGYPPITSGSSGCDSACYMAGGFDQSLALGDVDRDGKLDVFVAQDNAYLGLYQGDGRAFDAADIFTGATKWPGIRFYLDYAQSQAGWTPDEENVEQAHFTNSAPAIADLDGDGTHELIVLGSVQNAAQTDRLRGVALWVLRKDGTRKPGWESPYRIREYLSGLWDFEGTNVVGATNQVSVADLDATHAGLEMVFAAFDGRIYCVGADRQLLWKTQYTTDPRVLTGGVLIADLSGDGVAEVVFASYSPDNDKSHLFVLNAGGKVLHKLPLTGRGVMAVPTIADVDGNGTLEIVLSPKDEVEEHAPQVHVLTVPGSAENCLLWPTGRANLLRNGYVR